LGRFDFLIFFRFSFFGVSLHHVKSGIESIGPLLMMVGKQSRTSTAPTTASNRPSTPHHTISQSTPHHHTTPPTTPHPRQTLAITMGPAACCQQFYLGRLWSHEPWGYPARPQAAILSLKFPTGNKNQAGLTRAYRLLFAIGWTFWIFWSAFGTLGVPRACASARLIEVLL